MSLVFLVGQWPQPSAEAGQCEMPEALSPRHGAVRNNLWPNPRDYRQRQRLIYLRLERFGRSAPNPYSMTWQAVQHCPGIQINANSTGANSTPNQNPSRERRLHCGLEEVVSADFIGKLCSTGQVSKYRKGKAISWFEIACVRPLRKHVHHASKSRCSRCYREVYHTPAQG